MGAWAKVGNLRGFTFAQAVQTDAKTGAFSGSFPSGLFAAPPILGHAVVTSGDRDYLVKFTSVTVTGFTGQVRMSQKLPAVLGVLSTLAGFDPFTTPATAVTIHVTASPRTV